jgi:hypothetical protein
MENAVTSMIVSGPASDFELQFKGHEGLMFKILDSLPAN